MLISVAAQAMLHVCLSHIAGTLLKYRASLMHKSSKFGDCCCCCWRAPVYIGSTASLKAESLKMGLTTLYLA